MSGRNTDKGGVPPGDKQEKHCHGRRGSKGGQARLLTKAGSAEVARSPGYAGHQFLLDYGIDLGIYAAGGAAVAYVWADDIVVWMVKE